MAKSKSSFRINVINSQSSVRVDRLRIRQVVAAVLRDAAVKQAEINIAIVSDATIAKLHAEFLDDPDPTDVLSFVIAQSGGVLEGEIVASADTAAAVAADYAMTAEQELLLYVIHGALHLVGYNDTTPRERAVMRKQERKYLAEQMLNAE